MPAPFAESHIGRRRNQWIDVLRGLSIILVLITHIPLFWTGARVLVFGRTEGDVRLGLGYYGVAMFFVISGYLITKGTIERYGQLNRIDCSGFWWMRMARIVPMLFVALFAMVLFHYLVVPGFCFENSDHLWRSVTAALSFHYSDLLGHADTGPWSPLWSLSIEEMFYVVFPFVCLAINGFPAALWIAATVIASAVYLRFSGASPYAFGGCMDLLALGCFISVCRPERLKERWGARPAAVAGIVVGGLGLILALGSPFLRHPFDHAEWASLRCGAGAGLFIVASQLVPVPKWLSLILWPLSGAGVISYEIYLIHDPAMAYFGSIPGLHLSAWISVGLILALAAATHRLFSEPINQSLRAWRSGKPAALRGMRAILVGAAPLVLLVGAGIPSANFHGPVLVAFRIDALGDLPAGQAEPVVSIGHEGAGDLIYLKHLDHNLYQFGIDHWGGGVMLSRSLRPDQILNHTFTAAFKRSSIQVRDGDAVIVFSPYPTYVLGWPAFGANREHFSSSVARAVSSISRVGQ